MKTLKKPEQKIINRGFIIDDSGVANNFAIEPQVYVDESVSPGWTKYAEKLNGRLAMIGFVSLILTEILSRQTLVSLIIGS